MNIDYAELQESGFFEYVAKHGWSMSKEQLIDFVKELSYAAEEHIVSEYGHEVGRNIYKRWIESPAIEELRDNEV
jgi:hypothetical protein